MDALEDKIDALGNQLRTEIDASSKGLRGELLTWMFGIAGAQIILIVSLIELL